MRTPEDVTQMIRVHNRIRWTIWTAAVVVMVINWNLDNDLLDDLFWLLLLLSMVFVVAMEREKGYRKGIHEAVNTAVSGGEIKAWVQDVADEAKR